MKNILLSICTEMLSPGSLQENAESKHPAVTPLKQLLSYLPSSLNNSYIYLQLPYVNNTCY